MKAGYEFIGWECSIGDKIYGDGETYKMISGDVLFTAVWEKVDSPIVSATKYKVSYENIGGDGTLPKDSYYESGTSFEVAGEPVALDGKTFIGWKNSQDGKTYSCGDSILISDSDITLSAVWNTPAVENNTSLYWIWWVTILVVIVIIIWFIIAKKRKKDDDDK